jgi:hypothetical protein
MKHSIYFITYQIVSLKDFNISKKFHDSEKVMDEKSPHENTLQFDF